MRLAGIISITRKKGKREKILLDLEELEPPKNMSSYKVITRGRVKAISFVFMARTAEITDAR
jgi:hypothetical protein